MVIFTEPSIAIALTQVSQLLEDSQVRKIEFRKFVIADSRNQIDALIEEFGVVYVTSVTRDGCSGCEEQKPLFAQLAKKMVDQHKQQVLFSNIHVHQRADDLAESQESKRMLRHAAYPTYMIHVKSRFGPLEVYRAVYPKIEELEKQVNDAIELAEYYKTEGEKSKTETSPGPSA